MTNYNNFDNDRRRNEPPEEAVKRLRARIEDGDVHLKPELAEALMQSAQRAAEGEQFGVAIKRVEDALNLLNDIVKEGGIEFQDAIGRCLLFRAAIMRFNRGAEAGVVAFNDAIRHFTEVGDPNNPMSQNELAVALMNKADILINSLGAYSAAVAAQDQAARIWQRLFDSGSIEFRQPLISTLIACGESKIQSGDRETALEDFKNAADTARDGVADEDNACYPLLVQALLKLAKLYEQVGDILHAFETVRESIRTVKKLIADGDSPAQVMLTTLYLQHGMLYEKIGNTAAALTEFDHCRNVYIEVFRHDDWVLPGNFILRTGMANVSMCRGNMLADLGRFNEAAAAFEESVWQYQQAAEFQLQGGEDATFIPYSIGVVQLNHANMLVSQGKLEEAVAMKEEALEALKKRMEAGHEEILPNLLSAYRKMIGIRQMQNDEEEVFLWLDELLGMLELAVDEGRLEFRTDLAVSYHQRSIIHEANKDFIEAERDVFRAIRLFRAVADEDVDKPEVHVAKIQWAETLEHAAVLRTRQNRIAEAFDLLRKGIENVVSFLEEGNDWVVVDVLLGYTQFVDFVEALVKSSNFTNLPLKEEREKMPDHIVKRLERLAMIDPKKDELPDGVTEHTPDNFIAWMKEAQEYCRAGIELCQKKLEQPTDNLTEKMFFQMKIAFFHKVSGALYHLAEEDEKACIEFEKATNQWTVLLDGLENLKAKDRYYAAEAGETVSQSDLGIPGVSGDPYLDRYLYYINEYRQTVQRWANVCLTLKHFEESEKLYKQENDFTRDLMKKGVPTADRMLVTSLTAYANSISEIFTPDKVTPLYDEALNVMQNLISAGESVPEDLFVKKQVYVAYALYLQKVNKTDKARKVMGEFAGILESVEEFPPAELWLELCQSLNVHEKWYTDPKQLKGVRFAQKKLVTKYPDYSLNPPLKNYVEMLNEEIKQS
jgi:tetratricopeptide (TPR) repeat protein